MTFQNTVFIAKFGDTKNDWSDFREGIRPGPSKTYAVDCGA